MLFHNFIEIPIHSDFVFTYCYTSYTGGMPSSFLAGRTSLLPRFPLHPRHGQHHLSPAAAPRRRLRDDLVGRVVAAAHVGDYGARHHPHPRPSLDVAVRRGPAFVGVVGLDVVPVDSRHGHVPDGVGEEVGDVAARALAALLERP